MCRAAVTGTSAPILVTCRLLVAFEAGDEPIGPRAAVDVGLARLDEHVA